MKTLNRCPERVEKGSTFFDFNMTYYDLQKQWFAMCTKTKDAVTDKHPCDVIQRMSEAYRELVMTDKTYMENFAGREVSQVKLGTSSRGPI